MTDNINDRLSTINASFHYYDNSNPKAKGIVLGAEPVIIIKLEKDNSLTIHSSLLTELHFAIIIEILNNHLDKTYWKDEV